MMIGVADGMVGGGVRFTLVVVSLGTASWSCSHGVSAAAGATAWGGGATATVACAYWPCARRDHDARVPVHLNGVGRSRLTGPHDRLRRLAEWHGF